MQPADDVKIATKDKVLYMYAGKRRPKWTGLQPPTPAKTRRVQPTNSFPMWVRKIQRQEHAKRIAVQTSTNRR